MLISNLLALILPADLILTYLEKKSKRKKHVVKAHSAQYGTWLLMKFPKTTKTLVVQPRQPKPLIAATTHIITSTLIADLWTEDDISVIAPYREQAALYRKVFRHQCWFGIQVFTADSVQGRENKCTIFDFAINHLLLLAKSDFASCSDL